MNLYAFVGNNPTNLIDPHGLLTGVEETVAIYALTAVVGAAIIYFTSPAWDEASRGMADATRNFVSNINLDFAVGSNLSLAEGQPDNSIFPITGPGGSCPLGPEDDEPDSNVAKPVKRFEKMKLNKQMKEYKNFKKTYLDHLKKYGQKPGQTSGEVYRIERQLMQYERILRSRGQL